MFYNGVTSRGFGCCRCAVVVRVIVLSGVSDGYRRVETAFYLCVGLMSCFSFPQLNCFVWLVDAVVSTSTCRRSASDLSRARRVYSNVDVRQPNRATRCGNFDVTLRHWTPVLLRCFDARAAIDELMLPDVNLVFADECDWLLLAHDSRFGR